jgi:hypothetical protein
MALRKYLRARDMIGGFLKVTFHSHIRERSDYILCKQVFHVGCNLKLISLVIIHRL